MRAGSLQSLCTVWIATVCFASAARAEQRPPNILFIFTDDHAAHAIGCYGSKINQTPNLDRIAREGMRFTNCLCTNSLCGPSRRTCSTTTWGAARPRTARK